MELVEFKARSQRLEDGTLLVSVAGELDLHTVPELEREMGDADGAGPVVVELSECTFIDSTAVGVLVAARRRFGARGASLAIVATSAEIRRTFELTGLDREFSFYPSLASALNGGRR
jgi:anti-sigma B factor antagonist